MSLRAVVQKLYRRPQIGKIKTGGKSVHQTETANSQVALRLSGELCIKAPPTRRQFTDRLLHNLRDALLTCETPPPGSKPLRAERNRIFAQVTRTETVASLSRVFGIQSLALTIETPGDSLATITENGVTLFRDLVAHKKFAVRARRVGEKSHALFKSIEVARALGAALLPFASGVDLENPEVEVHVEFHAGRAFFFRESQAGPAGLPLGVEGRAVALLSGGFDSPVAAWQMLKRGVLLDYVFCNMGGSEHQETVLRVAKFLADRWSYGTRPVLHAIDFEPVMRELREKTIQRYWQVLLKRLMLRAAEKIAHERKALALITGEAVGQVSSQTLQNLAVISQATSLPILRPVVGMNKDEILALARTIGVHDLSAVVAEHCAMVPTKPATAAKLPVILTEETKLDLRVLDHAVATRTVLPLRELDLSTRTDLAIEKIPDGSIVLDLRSKAAYQNWHYPSALHLEFEDALRAFRAFDPAKTYLLVCEIGLKSAQLTELMRKAGFKAFHFAGGFKALFAHAQKSNA